MEIHRRFSWIFEIVLALVILSSAVSKNERGLLIDSTKPLGSCETAGKCNIKDDSIQPTNRSDNLLVSLKISATAKGECIPVPPPPNVTDDSDIPLQQRLADGIATMREKRLEVGADDKGIFLLGNTGSGKSTVTQLLVGNLSRIHSSITNSGEVVIFDEDDRIGAPTIRSKTLLPEYVAHKETGVIILDCPGFDDNRGTDMDIAAMYFLKNALDTANHAKFLFTVEYSAVKAGNDRLSFDLLMTHATTLIPNPIEKKDAIGLIVTKVPRVNDFGQLRTREQLLTGFKDFIEAYIDVKKSELYNGLYDEEKDKIQRKIDLAEIFLSDLGADQLPTRVSYFRSPEDCGALDELPEMLETKEMLTELYRDITNYTDVSPDDFKVTLKRDTLLDITNKHIPGTLDQIKNQTEIGAQMLQLNFLKKFHSDLENNDDLHPTQVFSRAIERLNWHMENIQTGESKFSSHLLNIFTDLYMDTKEKHCIIIEIKELENQLDFFEMVSGFNIPQPDPSWLVFLQKITMDLDEYLQFYDFCEKLSLDLGTYSKQLALELLTRKEQGIEFETDMVLDFLSSNGLATVPSKILELFNTKMSVDDKQYLADLVRVQIPNVTFKCESTGSGQTYFRLMVAGKNVRMSEIVNGSSHLPPAYGWPGPCSNKLTVKQITIFATESVYFDADLTFECNQVHVSIVAPEWEVIEPSKIMLGCYSIEQYNEPAPPGQSPGSSGSDGKNGIAGKDSGTFFGILIKHTNGNNLVINTDGGPAQNGQDGGAGVDGTRGRNAITGDFPSAMKCYYENQCSPAWEVSKFNFRVNGGSGTLGSNGGNGGNGGKPGQAGTVELVTGELSTFFNVSSNHGSTGRHGTGGSPGQGGENGADYDCRLGTTLGIDWFWTSCYATAKGRAPAGRQGTDGTDASPIDAEDKVPTAPSPDQLIISYKTMYTNKFTKHNFNQLLDNSPEFLRLQSPWSLAKELVVLETAYYQDKIPSSVKDPGEWEQTQLKYLASFENFLIKTKSYVKILTNESRRSMLQQNIMSSFFSVKTVAAAGITIENKVALNYIYITVLSKLVALRQNLMSSAKVIKTQEYFEQVEKKMETLRNTETGNAISDEYLNYHAILDQKTQEANNFIVNTVLLTVDQTHDTMHKMNSKLVTEVNDWLQITVENESEQKLIKSKLETGMPLRALFGILKVVGLAAQFMGPIGQTAGSVIRGVSGVISGLTLGNNPHQEQEFNLPPTFFTEFKQHTRRYYEDKIDTISNQLNITFQACNLVGYDLEGVRKIAEDTDTKLTTFKNMIQTRTNLPEETLLVEQDLDYTQTELSNAIETRANLSSNDIVTHLHTAFQLLEAGINLDKDLVGAMNDLKKLDPLIKDANQIVKMVKTKRDTIFTEFITLIVEALEDIYNAGKSLDGNTVVGLSVKRWKMQSLLLEMQKTMTAVVSGVEVDQEFMPCFDTLSRAVSLLLELYNHIERYEEKKELADYVVNINSVNNPMELITDPELNKTLTDLELIIHANLFLHNYQQSMSAFKQWVFPFPNRYLAFGQEELNLEEVLGIDKNVALDQMLEVYKNKVQSLSTQIMQYESTTVIGDPILVTSIFRAGLLSSRPFFIWSNDKWHPDILSFLSGNTIHLKADMFADPQMIVWFRGRTAIKYKCIRIRLRATDPSLQDELDSLLNYFHMRLAHSGISEYRVIDQKYVMHDSNQTYRYNFEDVSGESLPWNVIKDKICKNIDYLMSPFTWWTLTLLPATSLVGQEKFDELVRKFGDQVNLDLEGDGIYLDETNAEPWQLQNLKLENFYETYDDDTIAEFGRGSTRDCGNKRKRVAQQFYNGSACPFGEVWKYFSSPENTDHKL